jgi:hypothetical protein
VISQNRRPLRAHQCLFVLGFIDGEALQIAEDDKRHTAIFNVRDFLEIPDLDASVLGRITTPFADSLAKLMPNQS